MQIGDNVKLKSGGPVMTVTKRTADGTWVCTWYEHGDFKDHTFPEVALMPYA